MGYSLGMLEPVCQGCRERDARIAYLEQVVAELLERDRRREAEYCELESKYQVLQAQYRQLEQKYRDLETRLGVNASNSSLPPSANPPGAPPPVVKKPTGRQPGGQPGHPPHLRQRLPAERLTQPIHHYYPSRRVKAVSTPCRARRAWTWPSRVGTRSSSCRNDWWT